jgi:hypothetical protein
MPCLLCGGAIFATTKVYYKWKIFMVIRTSNVRNSYILGLIIITSFTGCAGLFDNGGGHPVEQPAEVGIDELNQYLKDWEETKLKVDRLVKIEDDLALIVQEVSKSSKLKNMPPEYSNKKITDFIEAEYENVDSDGVDLPEDSLNLGSKRQYYAAHLGLFLRKDNARIGWEILQRRYPKIFDQLTPLVKEIKRSDQIIYSLRVGPFDDLETSNLLCDIFVKYKYRCESTEFNGEAIQSLTSVGKKS